MSDAPALILYGMGSPNVAKVVLMLEECGLDFQFRRVNLFAPEGRPSDFTALAPNGKVPLLVDGEGGEPFVVFESAAILWYLSEKTGQLLPGSPRERAIVWQWTLVQMAGLGPMAGQLRHFADFAPEPIAYAQKRYFEEVRRLHGVLDARLACSAFVAGDKLSIADFCFAPWINSLLWREAQGGPRTLDFDLHSNIKRWYDAIMDRPSAKRAYALMERELARDIAAFAQSRGDR